MSIFLDTAVKPRYDIG
ncbi:MAG TPA: palindromic element RPE4 domain-containing protein [Rickettsia endosymbiont of Omalisus fontisbellaquei]|nr:palindromic element RPE4 domain-containing protein [Rickettsia endosymbiont of Omalisus fontisbellaquei]